MAFRVYSAFFPLERRGKVKVEAGVERRKRARACLLIGIFEHFVTDFF